MANELAQPRKQKVEFLNPAEVALDNGYWFVMSKGAILPESGGWAAQTEATKHDLQIYLSGLAYARYEFAREQGWLPGQQPKPKTDEVFDEEPPRDWTALA